MFLGYSVGVTVSYSWDFLICIQFCTTIAFAKNPAACFVWLVISNQLVVQFREACFTFCHLSNFEFDSLLILWYWFTALFAIIVLTHCLLESIYSWEKQRKLGLHCHSLTGTIWPWRLLVLLWIFFYLCAVSMSYLFENFDIYIWLSLQLFHCIQFCLVSYLWTFSRPTPS